jgi:hypothetical protein
VLTTTVGATMSMVNDGLVAPLVVFVLPAASLNEPPETLTDPVVAFAVGVNSTV